MQARRTDLSFCLVAEIQATRLKGVRSDGAIGSVAGSFADVFGERRVWARVKDLVTSLLIAETQTASGFRYLAKAAIWCFDYGIVAGCFGLVPHQSRSPFPQHGTVGVGTTDLHRCPNCQRREGY